MGKGDLACTSYRSGLSLCPPSQLDMGLGHPKSPPVPVSPREAHPLSCTPVLTAQLPLPPCPPAAGSPQYLGQPYHNQTHGNAHLPLKKASFGALQTGFL